ncbi:MAG: hypothetical protein ACKO2P_20950 [Planctomycetota bacterium]
MDGARSISALIFVCCLAVPVDTQAQSVAARSTRGAELLLLADGQLLEYPFSTRDDGYEVRFPGGPQFIESSRVLCVADSRTEAWRHLRSTFSSFSPDIHLRLARWCLRYQLPDCAERELLDALNLDPNRTDARELLEDITGRRLAASRSSSGPQNARAIPGAPGVTAAMSAQSLGGLTSENARSFVRRIQPLMSNRCGAAGCHGPGTTSDFRLSSIRSGSTPLTAERNLAAVLAQVTPEAPLQSPLLQRADQLHGGMQEPAFRGRVGAQQRQMLREWVLAAVHDLHPELAPDREPDDLTPSLTLEDTLPARRVTPAAAGGNEAGGIERAAGMSELVHGRPVERTSADKKMLEQAARAVASDPFSPALFNRRFQQPGTPDSTPSAPADDGIELPP